MSRGRNSFRPRIRGSIESATTGSRIHGSMHLHPVVVGFIVFLFIGPMWLFIQMTLESLESGRWDLRTFAIPAAVAGLIAVVGLAFAYESRRALRELEVLLDARRS